MNHLDRRALLQRALAIAGAVSVSSLSFEALAQAKPVLDKAHFELLSAVADTIIPKTTTVGAVDVGVPRLFDGLLHNWASASRRDSLMKALDEIDKLALAKDKKKFAALPPQRRLALLTDHDAAALRPVAPGGINETSQTKDTPTVADPNYGRAKQEPAPPSAFKAGEPAVANPGYAKLKELIVVLYYSSEPALTQELVYEHSPGEWQPSIPITPETRASGGTGYL
jgi:hypothetical protein